MEDHQEIEKPIFEFRHNKSRRSSRVSINREMNRYEELSRLRENPKKIQKSPLEHRLGTRRKKNEKSLIRCEECGKGFRYEKCLLNHRELIHPEESTRRIRRKSPLFSFFEDVQRRKRSKRVSRYKKITRFSVSSSFRKFPVSSVDDVDLLEVAESLILLSKSGGMFLNGLKLVGEAMYSNPEMNLSNEKKLVGEALDSNLEMNLRKAREFGDGFLWNEQKLVSEALNDEFEDGFLINKQKFVGVSTESVGTWKEFTETGIDQKLGCQETSFEDTDSGNRGFEMNNEHRCRLCDEVFATYQALGGHQTFHRASTKSESQAKKCKEESVEGEAEINGSVALTHECRVCSRVFRSVHALGSHKKCHNTRTFDGETFGFDLHVSMVNW